MRVLLDCDGVLSDFVGAALGVIGEVTGRWYGPSEVTRWDFGNLFESERESRAVWAELSGPGVAQELEVLPGAVDAVLRLRDAGHEIYVVTSPMPNCPTWTYERELWLRDHFGIDRGHIIHTSAKSLVCGDVLVDDNLDNVGGWVAVHRGGAGVLIDAPYNRDLRPEAMTRVPSLAAWAAGL